MAKSFSIGDNVKTNDYYESMAMQYTGRYKPIEAGTILEINQEDKNIIAIVKLSNGKKRSINVLFLETC